MTAEEYIIDLIEEKRENEFVDYKEFYYDTEKSYDLIKDVVSFANETTSTDKFIVFGIENAIWERKGINLDSMPDVSNITELLNVYVEPFLYIEIGSFCYDGKNFGYLKIPFSYANRPYIIKKEYCKRGQTFLRAGEIYIRKNANNFIANRRDLDEIYKHNGSVGISFFDTTIEIGPISVRGKKVLFGQVRVLLSNSLDHAINIRELGLTLSTPQNSIQYEGSFLSDKTRSFDTTISTIKDIPIHLDSGAEVQKSLFFSISEQSYELLLQKFHNGVQFFIAMDGTDVNGFNYQSEKSQSTLSFFGDIPTR